MEINPPTMVHRITITRSEAPSKPKINSAKCRVCGVILERNEGPLVIGVPGLYAVSGANADVARVWRVEEPLPEGMVLCTASVASA